MKKRIRTILAAALPLLLAPPLQPGAAAQRPPAPGEIIGHGVGESGHLADWATIRTYFDTLAASSPRVTLESIGESVGGHPMIMAVITSEANHLRLESIREGQAKLADPRSLGRAERERLVATQPAITLIGASLHGNEIMATQMSMELAYTLATDSALVAALDDVVVLVVPGMNPDGLDITRDWWLRTRETEYAGAPMPWLYHHYTGHDNNRDFFMVTQPETRAVTRVLYERWFPQVVYDVHQMGNQGERFFVPPFSDPLNPNLDPLLVRLTNLVGVQMALDLTAEGRTGVSHRERFDLWWHGGARTVPARHNMVGILTEAASADYGDPIVQSAGELSQPAVGSMYPEPWAGGEWRPRDIVEYELIAATSLVRLLARQRREFVDAYVTLAMRQIERGTAGEPYAYVVPAQQRDPGSTAELLRVLRRGGVEVHRVTAPIDAGGRRIEAGAHVVLMAQPYRAHAKDLLELQSYPEMRHYPGGPPIPPYDLSGWTLPLQMGVTVEPIDAPFALDALAPVDSIALAPARYSGVGPAVALDPRVNATHLALHEMLRREAGRVTWSSEPVAVPGGEVGPAGTPGVSGVANGAVGVAGWGGDEGVPAAALATVPPGRSASRLRVGLYRPWVASSDEGWTRWIFERWGVPFDSLRDRQIRAGGLRRRFDTIVVPDIGHRALMRGLDPARSLPEYAGGIGEEGAVALREFVREGGTLVLLDSSSEFAVRELGVPVRLLESGDEEDGGRPSWYAPGSLLRVRWDTEHPIALGMPDESAVFYAHSPVFETVPGATGVRVVGRYPESELLLSGYAQGEERVAGAAALVEATIGRGRVILFGFRPQHRAQTHETFKLLFNSLYPR